MNLACLGIKSLPARAGADRVVEAIAQRLACRRVIAVSCSRYYTPLAALTKAHTRLPHLLMGYNLE